ncbi:MAG: AMIN domain-containing protein [candidate division Zixibacteria bacterium]
MINRGIYISILTVCLCVFVAGAAPVSGANNLKDISVQKAGDSVVVIISVSQPCDFDTLYLSGKPQRVVVDLKGVSNVWVRKKFSQLPFKSIISIRTSQFQNNPLITRVVLDIGRPVGFSVEQKANDILVKLPISGNEKEFVAWYAQSARPVKAPKKTTVVKKSGKKKTKKTSSGVKIASYPKRKVVSYRTGKYRDPFMPLVGGVMGYMTSDLPVLENLTLVGILEDIDGNRALLEDAEGNGYMMASGDKIKHGYVVSVTKLKAIFQITEYGWTRTIALELDVPELR